jgi:hypothetical protein
MQTFVQSLVAGIGRRFHLPSAIRFPTILAVSGFCLQASAVVITTGGGAVTNFYDNFDFPGQLTAPGNTDADPIGGSPGSWSLTEDAGGSNINVIASTTLPDPGPAEGLNYLRIREPVSSSSRTRAVMNSVFSTGTVRADWMMYVPTNNISTISVIAFFPTSTGTDSIDSQSIASLFVPSGSDGFVNYRATNSAGTSLWVPLNGAANGGTVPYIAGTWQQWTFEVDLDTDLFRVAVENTFSSWLTNRNTGNLAALRFNTGAAGAGRQFYLDAQPVVIPEPASIALLGLASAVLLRLRRGAK